MKLQFLANPNPRRRSRPLGTRLPSPKAKPSKSSLSLLNQLLWALTGLLLTIGGTFVEAFATFPWNGSLKFHSLGVTCQIGAVLLVGCLGGKNAGALSQLAYVILGLIFIPVFSQGGGLNYLAEPTFGYLLGFIPGAWLCGLLAFQRKVSLESLALSCAIGLLAVHLVGISYLMGLQLFGPLGDGATSLAEAMMTYSIYPLPGQLAIICAVSVLGYILRQILFY